MGPFSDFADYPRDGGKPESSGLRAAETIGMMGISSNTTRGRSGTTPFDELLAGLPLGRIVLLGLAFGIYSDFLSDNAAGLALSLVLFASIVLLALVSGFEAGLSVFIVTTFLSPWVNRDMVQITELTGMPAPVYGLMTTRVASFTLVQWGFLFFGGLAVLHQLRRIRSIVVPHSVRQVFVLNLAVLLAMSLATTVDSLVFREFIDLRAIVSDLRFFLIVFFATFTALHFHRDPAAGRRLLERALVIAAVAGGVKAVFFLVHDFIAQRTSLYFNPQPYVFFPVFFAVMFMASGSIRLRTIFILAMVFLSAFSISRGDLVFAATCGLVFVAFVLLTRNSCAERQLKIGNLFFFIVGLAAIAVGGIYLANPAAFRFLLYKTSFFVNILSGGEAGESASLRAYEARNIFAEAVKNLYPVFIGRGFGGYFSLIEIPVPFMLGPGSYVQAELERQRYANPHGFLQYCFLKGGIVYITYYLGLIVGATVYALRRMRDPGSQKTLLLAIMPFLSVFALNMFWRPPIIFLFFLIFNLLLLEGERSHDRDPGREHSVGDTPKPRIQAE